MVLTRLQGRRFFKMFDALTVYANRRLDVVAEEDLITADARGIDERAQGQVAQELWQNLNVIDDFVAQNPAGLSAGELATVASWRRGLRDMFVAEVFPDGELRFMAGGYAFEVAGISRELAQMLVELPAVVETVLLPFDGLIVYAEYLGVHNIGFGQGVLAVFDDEVERIASARRYVASADALLAVADELREAELARDTEQLLADLESGAFGAGGAPGDADEDDAGYEQHRGVLAGLSPEERERAIDARFDAERGNVSERLADILDAESAGSVPVRSLSELLALCDERDARRFARLLGVEGVFDLEGDDLAAQVMAHLADEGALQDIVNDLPAHQLKALRALAEHGGMRGVNDAGIFSLAGLPRYEPGLAYVFHEDGAFTFVMPNEVLALAPSIDWAEALRCDRLRDELVSTFDKIAELRGLAPLEEAIVEYRKCYPDGYDTMQRIVEELLAAIVDDRASFDLLQTPDSRYYLMHFELMWDYKEEMGIEDDPSFVQPVVKGELSDNLNALLSHQRGKDARPLDEQMVAARTIYDWKLEQPCVRAFTRYLDEHVPDARDDYYFADKVIEDLLEEAKWGIADKGAQRFFDILEQNDFIPEASQMQELLNYWMAICNGLPIWSNNGWAPNDLAQQDLGHPVFLDDKGAPRKIGRNDPCPCGSGKKYKKCCGR